MTWISLSQLHYHVIWHFCILTSQQVVVHNAPTCFPAISPLCIKVDVSNIQPLFCQSKNVIVWPSVSFGYVLLFPWGFFFFYCFISTNKTIATCQKAKEEADSYLKACHYLPEGGYLCGNVRKFNLTRTKKHEENK